MAKQTHTNPVARTYARALLEVAGRERRDAFAAELDTLAGLVGTMPELRAFLASPALDSETKKRAIEALRGRIDDVLVNFLCVLVDKGRAEQLDEIRVAYRELADAAAGRARARVTTPMPLPDDLRARMQRALERRLNRQVVIEPR